MFENASRQEEIRALQERIRGMQRTRLEDRTLPTSAALAELLPQGALVAGGAYAVEGSTALALELVREPSRSGAWCAIVGMPDLGLEAAHAAGLDLDRLVLVPHPAEQWLAVVSALVDAIPVVLVRPPKRVSEAQASRLASRLRQREAVLVATSGWPRATARLSLVESDWAGIGAGFGHLRARQATVAATSPAWQSRTRSRRLWLPGAAGGVSAVVARVSGGVGAGERVLGAGLDEREAAPLRSIGRGA